MPLRKFFSGSKSEGPQPYPGPAHTGPPYVAQHHGTAAPLSPMFHPPSSSSPSVQPWQAPIAQGQASNGLPNQPYVVPPSTWQDPTAPIPAHSPAPSTYYSPPAQHQLNNVTYAPQPSPMVSQVATASPAWSVATPAENQVSRPRNILCSVYSRRFR